jgi:hypothetical protein
VPLLPDGTSMQCTAVMRPGIVSASKLAHDERVVLEELRVVAAVREIAIVGRVVVQPAEGRRVDREVQACVRERRHDLHAVAEIDRVRSVIRWSSYSHDGTSVRLRCAEARSIVSAWCMCATRASNIRSPRRLPLQVRDHAALAFGRDHVDADGSRLAEAPAAPHALVVLLERVRREHGDVGAVLIVEPPRADLGLRDEHARLAAGERE